jgi:uncharacterized YigZ family protein
MASADTYRTISSISQGLYREKGSKFISVAIPVSKEADIKSYLEEVRKEHHEARHHCYAYMIGADGAIWRANDDGEPSGTAGRPIMGQIKSFRITNVLIVVSRYFGGTLLGVSGLINAYKSAAESALLKAEIIDHIIMQTFEINYPWSVMNDVMKIIKDENIIQKDHSFEMDCTIRIMFRSSALEKIIARFSRVEGLNIRFVSAE